MSKYADLITKALAVTDVFAAAKPQATSCAMPNTTDTEECPKLDALYKETKAIRIKVEQATKELHETNKKAGRNADSIIRSRSFQKAEI